MVASAVKRTTAAPAPTNARPASTSSAAPSPQPVQVFKDTTHIVTARRVGDPGKGMQRIESPQAGQSPEVQAAPGSWLVAGIILFMVLSALLLAILAR
jgi:hypothetical protein